MAVKQLAQRLGAFAALVLPDAALTRMAGGGPVIRDGKTLDPKLQFLLRAACRTPPLESQTLDQARAGYGDLCGSFGAALPRLARIDTRLLAGPAGPLPVRLYVPRNIETPAPLTLFCHGGGFVLGDLPSYDRVCADLADRARCLVLAVDYRLAPEHPFPAAVEDCLAAWRWLAANAASLGADPARLAVAGDSAGAALSAVICQQTQAAGEPMPRFQLLIYPVTDGDGDYPSRTAYGEGFLLTAAMMRWFMGHYAPGGMPGDDPRFAVIKAPSLDGQPAAAVVIAGFDPLQDEGRAYAARLEAAGVAVDTLEFPSLIHGFIALAGVVPAAREAMAKIADALRRGLAG